MSNTATMLLILGMISSLILVYRQVSIDYKPGVDRIDILCACGVITGLLGSQFY